MSQSELLVRRIKNGTVLDHIKEGQALGVLSALRIDGKDGNVVTVAMNVPSGSGKRKDILKIENRFLGSQETDRVSLIAPNATVNIIKNYEVVEKRDVELPPLFVNVFRCPVPTCITNSGEPITPTIEMVDPSKLLLLCKYCRRSLSVDELIPI
ncbi:MAG: aspartate carbamoyltransferase regulatory subunit [Nitrososphaerales archaeon]